eukprot:COSAG01_NODE_7082_length_3361_cov_1.988964_3_plen_126_part_00
MDGQTQVGVFGQHYKIPGPDNPSDPCPFCGPPLPDNATRIMRKGYYLAVSWIDFLAGQIIGELDALGHKNDTVIALVRIHVSICGHQPPSSTPAQASANLSRGPSAAGGRPWLAAGRAQYMVSTL